MRTSIHASIHSSIHQSMHSWYRALLPTYLFIHSSVGAQKTAPQCGALTCELEKLLESRSLGFPSIFWLSFSPEGLGKGFLWSFSYLTRKFLSKETKICQQHWNRYFIHIFLRAPWGITRTSIWYLSFQCTPPLTIP
jgi:hypothetical protein